MAIPIVTYARCGGDVLRDIVCLLLAAFSFAKNIDTRRDTSRRYSGSDPVFFHYLRGEFSVVPVAMVLAASAAMLVAARGPQAVVAGVIIGLACVIWVLSPQGYSNITDTVAKSASYAVLDDPANGEARQSLGKALVVNQPLPIRAVVGSAYLWVFPVPFWHGFFTGSLYHILKSLHAVFAFFF